MGVFTRSHNPQGQTVTTTTTTTTRPEGAYATQRKPSLMQRLKGNHKSHTTHTQAAGPRVKKTKAARSNGTTRNGVPRRKVSLGDKVSGMMLKLKGSATHRPGEKAAGTRRMHGTDGRGSRRAY